MIKTHKSEFGSISYRLPAVDDVFMTMHFMGVDSEKSDSVDHPNYMKENQMKFMANLIRELGYFIESFDVTVDGKKLETYKEIKADLRFMKPLMAVAEDIIGALNLGEDEKKH